MDLNTTDGFSLTFTANISQSVISTGHVTAMDTQEPLPTVFEFSRDFMFYTLAVLIPAGLVCNTLSVMVFMARSLRNRAASWYLAALAISDDLSLLTIMVDYWLKDDRIGFTTIKTSHSLCVVVTYLSYATRLLSAWLVTSFTIERFIGVVYPLKRAALTTTSHARKVILSQTVACMVLTSFTLFTIGIVEVPYGTDCDVRPEVSSIYLVFNIVFVIFGSIVFPVLIICTLNMFILNKVYQRRKHFVPRNMRFNAMRPVSYKSPKDYNIATVLLVVSTSFVVLNVPYCICWFVLFFHHFKLIGPFGPNAIWQLYAAKYITSIPYYLNYSINFALYSLCARAFRDQLVRLVMCRSCQVETVTRCHGPDSKPTCLDRLNIECALHKRAADEPIPYYTHSNSLSKSNPCSRSLSHSRSDSRSHTLGSREHPHDNHSLSCGSHSSRENSRFSSDYSHGSRSGGSRVTRSVGSRGEVSCKSHLSAMEVCSLTEDGELVECTC